MVKLKDLVDTFEACDNPKDCFYLLNTKALRKLGYSEEELFSLEIQIKDREIKLK